MDQMQEQIAAETKAGLLPVVGKNLAWYAGERSAISARTLLRGPTSSSGIAKAMFGLLNTPEELERWTSGQSAFPLTRGQRTMGSKILSGFDPKMKDRGVLGTVYTPSSWMAAAKLGTNPGAYESWAYNAARGVTNTFVQDPSFMPPRRLVPKRVSKAKTLRGRGYSTLKPGTGENAYMEGAATKLMRSTSSMTNAQAADTINRMLRLGSEFTYKQSLLSDIGTGLWFSPVKGQSPLPYARYANWQSKGGIIGKIGSIAQRGAARRFAGVTASDIGPGLISKFGKVTTNIGMGVGIASRVYGMAYLGMVAGEAAYTASSMYFYKLPKAAISSVGKQMMREPFAGGDASLLTGIPANNRMRAVQAIQGSRLNARGALGSEASMMSGHFG